MGNCYCLKNSSSQNASGVKTVFHLEDDNYREVVNSFKVTNPAEDDINLQKTGDESLHLIKPKASSMIGQNNKNTNDYNERIGNDSYTEKKKVSAEPVKCEKNKTVKEKFEDTLEKVNNYDTISSIIDVNQQQKQQLNGMNKINPQEADKTNNSSSNKMGYQNTEKNSTNMNGNYKVNNDNILNNSSEIVINNHRPSLKSLRLTENLKLKDITKNLKDKGNSINVVLLGDKCVGKTSIIYEFISNKFDQYYIQTIIKEEFTKVIPVNGKKYNINFTVTSGVREYQEDYTSLYKISDFFVVCYDVTNIASFEKAMEIIMNEILPYVFLYNKSYSNIILVGNKCDIKERTVDQLKVKEFCEKHFIDFYETSAKLKTNISKIFRRIVDVYDEAICGITE